MLRWIGGFALVLVIIFTSVTAVSNNSLLEEQAEQIAKLQKVCSPGSAPTREVTRAMSEASERERKYNALIEKAKHIRTPEDRERLLKEAQRIRRGE